jgi:hypothetical protein
MGLEGNTHLGNTLVYTHTVNLVASALGKERLVPVHKLVETAQGLNQLMPRSQEEMIGIGKDNFGTKGLKFFGNNCFDGSLRTDRDKGRGINHSMVGRKPS